LHGRGGNALEDCRKWARVARRFGWIVCPQGPAVADGGGRAWNNDADTAKKVIDATVAALKDMKVKIVPGLGHEVPGDRMITNYRRPLKWLIAAR
jgi:hypothetical protein